MDNSRRWALEALKENRDTPGQLYHDNGRHIVYLAREAGTRVEAVHVDLTERTTTYYTVTPEGKREYGADAIRANGTGNAGTSGHGAGQATGHNVRKTRADGGADLRELPAPGPGKVQQQDLF